MNNDSKYPTYIIPVNSEGTVQPINVTMIKILNKVAIARLPDWPSCL